MPQVLIRHPKTGTEHEIASGDFRHGKHVLLVSGDRVTYEEAGYRIVSNADGSPYTGPLNDPPAERKSAEG